MSFTLRATAHTVDGSFEVRSGEIVFDENGRAEGRVVIDARSGDTGNERRDRKMHDDVLESERYPTFVFEPSRFEGELPEAGEGKLVLLGHLTLHGTRREVAIPTSLTRKGSTVEASGEFEVPYVEWGLEDPSVFLLRVAKEVQVRITLSAELE